MLNKAIKILIWMLNVILRVVKNPFRVKNKWVFGAWGGDFYSDNSKYLYEYILSNRKDIDAIWITKSKLIKDELKNKNYKVYMSNEIKGRWSRFSCSKLFYTNGINDVGNINLCSGAEIISLWHGMPLKKLLYAQDKFKNNIVKKSYNKLYSDTIRNKTISTSEMVNVFFKKCYEIDDKDFILSGQPRNDILFDLKYKEELKKKYNLNKSCYLLFMPTWRNFGNNEGYLYDFLYDLSCDQEFNSYLKSEKIILLVKLHPRVKLNLDFILSDNILVVDSNYKMDTQELMLISDVLITDYSSVFIDYCLMDKPIIYYVPDIDEYIKNNHDLFLDFDDFSCERIQDILAFKSHIIKNLFGCGLSNTLKARNIYHDYSLINGGYSEKLLDHIK